MLWLDVDTIVKCDVVPIVRNAMRNPHGHAIIAAVGRKGRLRGIRFDLIKAPVPAWGRPEGFRGSFNAGVMVIDLDRWKKANLTATIQQIVDRNREEGFYRLGSQPPLSLAIGNRLESLGQPGQHWNVNSLGWLDTVSNETINAACLLHWTGPSKPWKAPITEKERHLAKMYTMHWTATPRADGISGLRVFLPGSELVAQSDARSAAPASVVGRSSSLGSDYVTQGCGSPQDCGARFAVYTYNFGDPRKKSEWGLARHGNERERITSGQYFTEQYSHFPDADWWFFSDSSEGFESMRQQGWHTRLHTNADDIALDAAIRMAVLYPNISKALTSSRGLVLTKWYKYGHLPAELKKYDYIVHVDGSTFQNPPFYHVPTSSHVRNMIGKYPATTLFLTAHARRRFVREEWATTARKKYDKPANLIAFKLAMVDEFGADVVGSVPLFKNGKFVRKIRPLGGPGIGESDRDREMVTRTNRAFEATFTTMVRYGIRRDQNVHSFMLLRELGAAVEEQVGCLPEIVELVGSGWRVCLARAPRR